MTPEERTDYRPPMSSPVRYPSKSLCAKALRGIYGSTARFQTMTGKGAGDPSGVRALVRFEGRDLEIASLTPKNGHTLADMEAEPGIWYALFRACANAAGCVAEVDGKGTIYVRRDPAELAERLREIETKAAPIL